MVGQVYDVSFGGVDFYGPGKPYNFMAGKDAARALAKVGGGGSHRLQRRTQTTVADTGRP